MIHPVAILQTLAVGWACCASAPDSAAVRPATAEMAAFDPAAAEADVAARSACPLDDACPGLAGLSECDRKECHWSDLLKDLRIRSWTLDIGGSLRHRFEHQENYQVRRYGDPNAPSDTFVLQRFRLDLDLHHPDGWRTFMQWQDARPFGTIFSMDDFALGNPYWNYFDLRQAYVERQTGDGRPLGFRIGRQIITYRDTRVWGPGEWGNVGRYSWDVAKLTYDVPAAQVDCIFGDRVLNDANSFDIEHYPFHAYGVYAMLKPLPFQLDLFYIGKATYGNEAIRAGGQHAVENIHSFGFYVDGRWHEAWDYGGTFAATFGDRDGLRVSACGGNARLGYTFDAAWQPRLSAQYSFASGDPDPGDGRDRTFDGLFGAIDSMYGWMNIFAWKNLRDYQATVNLKPGEKTEVVLDWHYFQLDEARDAWYYGNARPQRHDPSGASGRELGHEIDLIVYYNHSDHWRFRGGYSHFFPGSFIRLTGPSPPADWFYVQTMWQF